MTFLSNHVPNRRLNIAELGTDFFGLNIEVNRAIWRSVPFKRQSEINLSIQKLSQLLDDTMEEMYPIVNDKIAEKELLKDAKTSTETSTETSPETSPETISKNSGKRKSGESNPDSIPF